MAGLIRAGRARQTRREGAPPLWHAPHRGCERNYRSFLIIVRLQEVAA